MEQLLSIETAEYVSDYKIHLKFNDGTENTIDFSDFILNSQHPDIRKYQDIDLFKNFNLVFGEIEWNDYDLAFPIYDLYQGRI